ncbi:hypothetical protein Klosneuvirus_2_203 [Klosneuvirus KNV1]|uniref:Uncharacterized protein n=1 Tax=Klosneuvirus KNV1 TaxID=1977640 RepID=A0A1V0SJ66_9VIRU|nr:hypothetical protein Klosneuvirus_2_203 [Klosneuvirus KNV1]
MGAYTFIDSFRNNEIFRNTLIIIAFILFFLQISIELNIILGLVLAYLLILYLKEKDDIRIQTEEKEKDTKLSFIKPHFEKINKEKDKDFIDFVFSVQDFYVFNPRAYEEFIDNMDSFFELRELVFNDETFNNYYFQIADSKKNNALNSFHSLIFSLPNDKTYTEKFDRAHKRLETLLNREFNKMYDQITFVLQKNGPDTLKRPVSQDLEPKSYMHYFDDKDFTYQFY